MTDSNVADGVRRAVDEALRAGQVPGMVLAVARTGQPVQYLAIGEDALGQPLTRDSLFPVASITKMATALSVLHLADAGILSLDHPIAEYLPSAASAEAGVTIRSLLCHSSGLPIEAAGSSALYANGLDWPALATSCLLTSLEAPPDTRVQYSNVGYGLLAVIVENQTGKDFPVALAELVLEPLGVEAYLGAEPPRAVAVLAGVRGRHIGSDLEPFNSVFWRGLAFPWAGLVTTVEGALTIVRAFWDAPHGVISKEICAEATRSNTGDLGGGFVEPLFWRHCPWGLGPDIRGQKTPHWAPAEAGPDSFGHSGASGALAWVSPAHGVAWALLGARTADNGWLLRRAPAIGAAIIESCGITT
jgi:beta-lactamase class C